MVFKKIVLPGTIAGALASAAAMIYDRIFFFAMEADFSSVLNWKTVIGINLVVCMLAAVLSWMLKKWLKEKGEVVFNFAFSIFSFAFVIVPISYTLPLDVSFPELFPGLAAPMVFFPVIAWLTIHPLFKK